MPRRRAYHFGPRFHIEMEVVLPQAMSVRESHDIALALQHKVHSGPGLLGGRSSGGMQHAKPGEGCERI